MPSLLVRHSASQNTQALLHSEEICLRISLTVASFVYWVALISGSLAFVPICRQHFTQNFFVRHSEPILPCDARKVACSLRAKAGWLNVIKFPARHSLSLRILQPSVAVSVALVFVSLVFSPLVYADVFVFIVAASFYAHANQLCLSNAG